MGNRLAHGLRRSSHWQGMVRGSWDRVNLSVSHGARRCYTVPSSLGSCSHFFIPESLCDDRLWSSRHRDVR